MPVSDPNRAQLIRVGKALGTLRDEVVFVGGATVGLFITDAAAPAVRPTKDVDVIVEVASYASYQHTIAPALKRRGFEECRDADAPLCAWNLGNVRVDVMPTDERALGFTNQWYAEAIASAEPFDLEETIIQVISPPLFLATKLLAFEQRGHGDYLSHDVEDILAVINGRIEILEEVAGTAPQVAGFIRRQVAKMLESDEFLNLLPGLAEAGRDEVIRGRLEAMVGDG